MKEHEATNPVTTSLLTLRIIDTLEAKPGMTLADLARYLDKPKSTLHNHLSTLLQEEYIVKEEERYYLGLRFTELGEQAKNRHEIAEVGQPEVENLAEETGELCNLAIQEHGQAVYIHRSQGENAISTDTFSGKRVALHSTSLGKAMLAYMPKETVDGIIDRTGLPAETEHTITDPTELYDELKSVRENKIAFDDEERAIGIRCVSAPIIQHDVDRPIGAVSVSAPVNRMQDARFTKEIPALLHQAVNVLEIELTYHDSR